MDSQLLHIPSISYRRECRSTILKENTPAMLITGNEPVTNVPFDEDSNENEINNGNETVNIPHPPYNDVEFDIAKVQVPVSSSD